MSVNVEHVCLNGYANAVVGPVPKVETLIIHVHATSFDGTATYDTVMTDASSSNENNYICALSRRVGALQISIVIIIIMVVRVAMIMIILSWSC